MTKEERDFQLGHLSHEDALDTVESLEARLAEVEAERDGIAAELDRDRALVSELARALSKQFDPSTPDPRTYVLRTVDDGDSVRDWEFCSTCGRRQYLSRNYHEENCLERALIQALLARPDVQALLKEPK